MTTCITFRTDAELKADVEEILDDIGMDMSTALNCFGAKIRDVGGIPFALTRKSKHQRILDAYNEAKMVRRSNPSIRIMRFPATLGGLRDCHIENDRRLLYFYTARREIAILHFHARV